MMDFPNIKIHFITISVEKSGQRIDNFLFNYLKKIPKDMIYRIIRKGNVRVNKKRIAVNYRLQENDQLRIPPIESNKITMHHNIFLSNKIHEEKTILDNSILYEDKDLLVLNKPSGWSVHSGNTLKFGIIERLRIIRPNEKFLELVHRLDRDTSGVLLFAKSRFALLKLHKQFYLKTVRKEYLALVYGKWPSSIEIINIPLLKNICVYNSSNNMRSVCVDVHNGKLAETRFLIQERFSSLATLITIFPITGRTHQIRIHTQHVGHPIACDKFYGNKKFNKKIKNFGLNRLFLHASFLQFIHPNNGKILSIHAPLDGKLQRCLFMLRKFIRFNNN